MQDEISELEKKLEEKQKEEQKQQELVLIENENKLVNALVNNETAIEIAKQQYADLKNQKQIAKKMGEVVNKKTNADIETADLLVKDQVVDNKTKKAEQRNRLLQLRNERAYLKKEQTHKLAMQRARQLYERHGDLLLRTCRKRQKGDDGKYHFVNDENGKPIINTPSPLKFFFIRLFDGIVSTLNLTAEIFGALNKNVLKGGFILLILLCVFVPPFRSWLLGLIGISF